MELTVSFTTFGELKVAIDSVMASVPAGASVKFTRRGATHILTTDSAPVDEAEATAEDT